MILIKGNFDTPTLGTDKNCYVVGYTNATLGVSKNNTSIAIRSVKYSSHKASNELRAPADPTSETRITILLDGEWEQNFWTKDDRSDVIQHLLTKKGDFLVWHPGYWHDWRPRKDSLMLTVSLFDPQTEIKIRA